MAKIYANLISKGLKSLSEVPAAIRDAISKILNNTEGDAK